MENIELLENEYFVPIKEYEGLYEISNLGRIKSLERKIKNGLKSKNLQEYTNRLPIKHVDKQKNYKEIADMFGFKADTIRHFINKNKKANGKD